MIFKFSHAVFFFLENSIVPLSNWSINYLKKTVLKFEKKMLSAFFSLHQSVLEVRLLSMKQILVF